MQIVVLLVIGTTVQSPASVTHRHFIVGSAQGDKKTIAEALKGASDGDVIDVAAGVYKESLVITRNVTIEAARGTEKDAVTLHPASGAALTLRSPSARISGLFIEPSSGDACDTLVLIDAGSSVMENCRVRGAHLACVAIDGQHTSPKIVRCKVEASNRDGILVAGGATPTITDVAFNANSHGGLTVSRKGNPVATGCLFTHRTWNHDFGSDDGSGIIVEDAGLGLYDHCTVSGPGNSAIMVKSGSTARVRGCTLEGSSRDGITVQGATARIAFCTISAAEQTGVAVDARSTATILNCTVDACGNSGIWIWNKSHADVQTCDVGNCRGAAISLGQDCAGTIASCNIHDNRAEGIYMTHALECRISDTKSYGNGGSAILVTDKSKATIITCTVHDSYRGVSVERGGSATMKGCDASSCRDPGIAIVDSGSSATIDACNAHENEREGINVWNHATASISNCDVWGNKLNNLGIDGTRVIATSCTFHASAASGVGVINKADAQLISCRMADNTHSGVSASSASQVKLVNCQVTANGGFGVVAVNKASVAISGGSYDSNTLGKTTADQNSSIFFGAV